MLNREAFFAGFVAKAKTQPLVSNTQAFQKIANILRTSDSVTDIANSLDRPIELRDVAQHNLVHSIPYAGDKFCGAIRSKLLIFMN